jgi:hypothetical protein
MLKRLQNYYGFPDLTKKALIHLRSQLGLINRHRRAEDRSEARQEAVEFILKELRGGLTGRWGQRYIHTWVRKNIKSFVSLKDTRILLKFIDNIGVEARTRKEYKKRKRYFVKGPNRVWSVDGHDKLAEYGFQIYGIIDAYSRYIVGVYVGMSNRTQVAVEKFYL